MAQYVRPLWPQSVLHKTAANTRRNEEKVGRQQGESCALSAMNECFCIPPGQTSLQPEWKSIATEMKAASKYFAT